MSCASAFPGKLAKAVQCMSLYAFRGIAMARSGGFLMRELICPVRELFPKGRGILPQQRRHMPAWHFGNLLLLLLIFIYFHCGIVLAKLMEN
jgi:hypothetical protein